MDHEAYQDLINLRACVLGLDNRIRKLESVDVNQRLRTEVGGFAAGYEWVNTIKIYWDNKLIKEIHI